MVEQILNLRYQKITEPLTLDQRLQRVNFIDPLPNGLYVKMEMNGPINLNYNGGSIESRIFEPYGYVMTETVKWEDGSEIIIDRDAIRPDFHHEDFQERDDRNDGGFPVRQNVGHLGASGVLLLWSTFVIAIIIMICSWKCRNWVRNRAQNDIASTTS